jgi:DNA-directed RNA polymerase subunit RPC12/RpoP
MTRGPDYLIAHACFDCRKSWKVGADSGATCPQCGSALHEMGRSFKIPKKSDTEQWAKVQSLWEAGFRFWSYRSHPDAEPLPDRLRDVEDFIVRNPEHPMRVAR